MIVPRRALRAQLFPVALCLAAACAADAGDPLKKTTTSASTVPDGSSSLPSGDQPDAQPGGGNMDTSPGSSTGFDSSPATQTGQDSGPGQTTAVDSSTTSSDVTTGPMPDSSTTDEGGVSGCLASIPSSCPNCATMNASDMPKCQAYLTCFSTNSCNPMDSCFTNNDGVCGLNKIGGGSAPAQAAAATYMCACP